MDIAVVKPRNPHIRGLENYYPFIAAGHKVTLFSQIDNEKLYRDLPDRMKIVNLRCQEFFYKFFPKKNNSIFEFLRRTTPGDKLLLFGFRKKT